jgi:hypothetical protein
VHVQALGGNGQRSPDMGCDEEIIDLVGDLPLHAAQCSVLQLDAKGVQRPYE